MQYLAVVIFFTDLAKVKSDSNIEDYNKHPGDTFNYVNFIKYRESYLNNGTIISKNFEKAVAECLFNCFNTTNCVSLNILNLTSAEPKFCCELLSSDMYNSSTNLTPNKTSLHYTINSPCQYMSCANNGTCVTKYGLKNVTGTCECQPGYEGPRCQKVCETPLGMQSDNITDAALNASSYHSNYFAPRFGRLYRPYEPGVTYGCWMTLTRDTSQYLQVNLGVMTAVTEVATQGRAIKPSYPNGDLYWVKTYKVLYLDEVSSTWSCYQEGGVDKIFTGNTDRETVVTNTLPYFRLTRLIRFNPQSWNGFIAMRCEIYGCVSSF